jgi:hypothetical protein
VGCTRAGLRVAYPVQHHRHGRRAVRHQPGAVVAVALVQTFPDVLGVLMLPRCRRAHCSVLQRAKWCGFDLGCTYCVCIALSCCGPPRLCRDQTYRYITHVWRAPQRLNTLLSTNHGILRARSSTVGSVSRAPDTAPPPPTAPSIPEGLKSPEPAGAMSVVRAGVRGGLEARRTASRSRSASMTRCGRVRVRVRVRGCWRACLRAFLRSFAG